MSCGHVGDDVVEIARTDGLYRSWYPAGQREDHGDVVGSKAPQDVLLAPDAAQVEARRIDVAQVTQGVRPDQLVQLQERRMVLHQVADHKH